MSFPAKQPVLPPVDGSVTLPEVLDFHSQHNPKETIFTFHADGDPAPTNISYLEFQRAADRAAHILRPGRTGVEREIVAVIALSDTLLYHAVSFGLMRAGVIPFLMSPRNTASAIVKMMRETCCHRLLATKETLRPLLFEVLESLEQESPGYHLSLDEMPPFHEIFPHLGHETEADPFEPYPKAVTRPDLDETAMYLHSSGSTGFPKSIAETFRILTHWAKLPAPQDKRESTPRVIVGCMALPAFHTLGVISQTMNSAYGLMIASLYPPTALTPTSLPVMPTPDNILDHLRRTKSNALITIPTLLQIWAQDKRSVSALAELEYVAYSGGSAPTKLGDLMTDAGVSLHPIYGATEFGGISRTFRKPTGPSAWEWVAFDDNVSVRMDPQGDGTYECQFLTCDYHQPSVENMTGEKGYATSDLFIPHPTDPGFWKIVGRKDDVIIHSSGEKTVPAPMENIIMNSTFVMGVVMFGREHDQPGVLVELKPGYVVDPEDEEQVILGRNLMWPVIEEANKVAPAFSRVFKELILFCDPAKPLPRAGKGTIMRKAALALYNEEIEDLYDAVASTTEAGSVITPPTSWKIDHIEAWIQEEIEDIQSGQIFSVSGDLFEQGMDSLSTTILRRRISMALLASEETHAAGELITQNTIYNNPSIRKLASFIASLISAPDTFLASSGKVEAIEDMIEKYSFGLDRPLPAQHSTGSILQEDSFAVLLTGTTGNLGSQLLDLLLRDVNVSAVYALNRGSKDSTSILERHFERFQDKALDSSLLSSEKLVLLEGDTSAPQFGLPNAIYDQLLKTVTVVIHNAWKLDFNHPLSSFEPLIRGTRNLIDFCRETFHSSSIKFLFTSSISSASSWDTSLGSYPEEVVTDARYAMGNGYGESKYVAERILASSGLKATSFRIGQVSGGEPNGAWATSDWVPIMLKSSVSLSALPSMTGFASWIPMHTVSQAIADVALGSTTPPALNLVHPRPLAWDSLLSLVNESLLRQDIIKAQLPVISLQEWYTLLEDRSRDTQQDMLEATPAVKLLDFFRSLAEADRQLRDENRVDAEAGGLPTLSTSKAQSVSQAIEDLLPLESRDVESWITYWKAAGLFD